MPITVPPFVQYQQPIIPLRGLWNHPPPEGDQFVAAEIDWGVTVPAGTRGVQFSTSANSPVAFSQIVALAVDNSRSGSDVQFLFTDSGFVLNVPAGTQGVFPVFTNATSFYVVASAPAGGDITAFAALNSMPPPVQVVPPDTEAATASASNVNLGTNQSSVIIPSSVVAGTIESAFIVITSTAAANQVCVLTLRDGNNNVLFTTQIVVAAGQNGTYQITLNPVRWRFQNGVNLVITGTTITPGSAGANVTLLYSTP